ncbi:MAG: FAD-dependent oxidoreductase [Eubacteriales bacterium]|nr:FAD-dependent oxidoreductase [Eubacteriales bacterium]
MESVWSRDTQIPSRETLHGNISADIAIIGAGMAGVLIAYSLKKIGYNPIILEASRIGSGQTKNTTAKITSQHNLIYHKLIAQFGKEQARQYAEANQRAVTEYRNIISRENIDCRLETRSAFLYSKKNSEPLIEETEAAQSLGIPADFTTTTALPFEVAGAVVFRDQAQFHPLKFLEAISKPIEIYENTRVKTVEENKIITDNGTITASHIVFAAHYPFINVPGYYFLRMHQERSYVIALEKTARLDGMYLGIGSGGLSFRDNGSSLLLGGGGHRTGENSDGGIYNLLRQKAKEYYPDSVETACWSAQDCMTVDGVPYIGRYSSATPGWYVATGFQKWGMTSSMVSAMIISDLITRGKSEYEEVFSPNRFKPSASLNVLFEEGKQAVKGQVKMYFYVPKEHISHIENGHGGIIDYNEKKIGVYKDDTGHPHFIEVKCPHLGCQLEWNPDEKSWDCPCHGSRFDYKGNLLDNPAQSPLLGGYKIKNED